MKIVFATPGLSNDSASREGIKVRSIVKKYLPFIGKAEYHLGHITFRIKDAFRPRSSAAKNAMALEALLSVLTELNCHYLRTRKHAPYLYNTRVIYSRTHVWDTIPALYMRGYGDCKSLTCARVAELLVSGRKLVKPVFRFDPKPNGTMFHILVMYPDGSWEDPSRLLGMRGPQELSPH